MSAWPASLLALAALSALISGTITALVVRHGQHGLGDAATRHRLHAQPVPRGGGLGIALVGVAALGALGGLGEPEFGWRAYVPAAALALVAVVGLLDDWRDLPIVPRLLVQALAAVAVGSALLEPRVLPPGVAVGLAVPLAALA